MRESHLIGWPLWVVLLWLSLSCHAIIAAAPATGPSAKVEPCFPAAPELDRALTRHVRDGLVDYPGLSRDSDFAAHLERLGSCRLDALKGRESRLAFWINAYNALVLKGVLDHYPIKSVADVGEAGKWSFFRATPFQVAGAKYTLDDIEHRVIRAEFGEPRVHFALVCASAGCPALKSTAYHPDRLEAELEDAASRFVKDESRVRIDREHGVLYLSSIFKWYEEDFVKSAGSTTRFVSRYLEPAPPAMVHVEYLDYSWDLNELKRPANSP